MKKKSKKNTQISETISHKTIDSSKKKVLIAIIYNINRFNLGMLAELN
jgi:hypothetical protein